MEGAVDEGQKGGGEEEFTLDGTVDLHGMPCIREKGGGWTACSFIIGFEMFERMAYNAIASNLIVYLTKELHQGTVTSSNNVTNWAGTVWMTPILGAYIADAHLGRYWTFVVSSFVYLAGMGLLTLAVTLPSLKPPQCPAGAAINCGIQATSFQLGIFYSALYLMAIGNGGTKPNISTMGADQFDAYHPREGAHKLTFYNWWMFSIFLGGFFANTVLVYIQERVGWGLGYAVSLMGLGVSVTIFLIGTKLYRHRVPGGSSVVVMGRVTMAAIWKWRVAVPSDARELHEVAGISLKAGPHRVEHTDSMRFLDRAAVMVGSVENPWTLCTVTQVEETKMIYKLLPLLVTTFLPSMISAQVITLFVKQGTTLDLSMGPNFSIPPACLISFVTIFMLLSIVIYDRFFIPAMRKRTNNPRGISLLQRMGIGIVLQVFIMVVAAVTERYRLYVAERHGLSGNATATLPLTIFAILPQFALSGIADAFVMVAQLEFFYDQAPEGMKSLGTSFFCTGTAMGNFVSSFLLKTVARVTGRDGRGGWIQNNLNASRLDYYYAFLAVLCAINLLVFVGLAVCYKYNGHAAGAAENNNKQSEMLQDGRNSRKEEGNVSC